MVEPPEASRAQAELGDDARVVFPVEAVRWLLAEPARRLPAARQAGSAVKSAGSARRPRPSSAAVVAPMSAPSCTVRCATLRGGMATVASRGASSRAAPPGAPPRRAFSSPAVAAAAVGGHSAVAR